MRITNAMMVQNFKGNMHRSLTRLDHVTQQLVTERQNPNISDNPSATIFSQTARSRLARLELHRDNVGMATDWLIQAEQGMSDIQELMRELYVGTVQASTDVLNSNQREAIAEVASQFREHLVDTLNMTFGNRFVFAGFNTPGNHLSGVTVPASPFRVDDDGNLLFNGFNMSVFDGIPGALFNANDPAAELAGMAAGDHEWVDNMRDSMTDAEIVDIIEMMNALRGDVKELEIASGVRMPVTMSGIDMIMFRTRVDGEYVFRNVFEVVNELDNLLRDENASVDEISEMILPLQNAQTHLVANMAEVGGRMRRLEVLEARYSADYVNFTRIKMDIEGIDMPEVIMRHRMAEAAFQVALAAGARIIQPTLMDFLR